MQRTSRTITPYRPGTRSEFMSPDLHMLSVQVDPDGTAYLFNGCMIVDTRENSADMTIPDAQRWCVDYEARAARECHEANVGAADEDCGFAEVPAAEPVDAEAAEWEGHVNGIIATESARLAPLSGTWAVYCCDALVTSRTGQHWAFMADIARIYAMADRVYEGDVWITLNGKRAVWF